MNTQVKQLTDKDLLNYSPTPGEVVIATSAETGESLGAMVYNNNKWNPLVQGLKLYDLNKQIIQQMPDMDLSKFPIILESFCKAEKNQHYMLYGKELSYFTIFKMNCEYFHFGTLFEGIVDCISHIRVVDYDPESHGIEIWGEVNEELSCFYLFPYDAGFITIG